MFIWSNVIQALVMLLVTLAQVYGGNLGLAIITLSLVARLALLPVTLRLARRAQRRQEQLKALQPQIDQLRRRYRSNPERLAQELTQLYRRHGYSLFDPASVLGSLVQLPIFVGLCSAIREGVGIGGRFLWIANLAQPDLLMTAIVAVLTYAVSIISPGLPQSTRYLFAVLPALITALFLWQLAAGLGLYWATSSTVNLLQSMMLRRKAAEPGR